MDDIKAEFPANAFEKRALIEEIDLTDEDFLDFLELLPSAEDPEELNALLEKYAEFA